MASFGHVAVGCFAGRALHPRTASTWALLSVLFNWTVLSMLPDFDVVAFALHIPYGAPFGHRGAAHSLVMAAAVGFVTVGVCMLRVPWQRALVLGVAAMLVVTSHDLLDTLTDGGLGVALFWPFDDTRYFAPWRPIPVAPIGAGMLSRRGLYCVLVELAMFVPFWGAAAWMTWRSYRNSGQLT